MTTTYTCQHDHCRKTGTNSADFKKIEHRGAIQFAYVLCNEHAQALGGDTRG